MRYAVLALLLVGFALALRFLVPLRAVEVVGAARLPPEAVARKAGLHPGSPWLFSRGPAEARLREHPLVAEVRVRYRGLGRLRIELTEREPFARFEGVLGFPSAHRLAVDLDAAGRPLPTAEAERRLEGPEGELTAALAFLREHPEVKALRFGPGGYLVTTEAGQAWLASLKIEGPIPPRGRVYAWGVSVGP